MRQELKDYINTNLTFNSDGDLIYNNMNIMNKFEEPLINHIAESIISKGDSVLNIGYGLGFFDKKAEKIGISSHTIIECHPNIVNNIDIPNAKVYEGVWQDYIDTFLQCKITFDCIFFDTYIFNKKCLDDEWFSFLKYADKLLNKNGKLSVFNWFKDGIEITEKLKETMKHLKLYEEVYKIKGYDYKHLFWEKL